MKQQWTGPHDDSAPLGEGVTVLQNVFTGSKGEIVRRPGWAAVDTWTGINWMSPLLQTIVLGADGTNLKTFDVSNNAKTTIGAYGTPTASANLFGATYLVGGGSNVEVTTSAIRTMGLAAPATPTITHVNVSGTPTLGTHLVRMRRHEFSSTYNRYSDPSEAVEIEYRKASFTITVTAGVLSVQITDPGSGYRPNQYIAVGVVGDGTGASFNMYVANVSLNAGVTGVSSIVSGSGYTYATAIVADPDAKIQVASTAESIEYTTAGGSLYYAQSHTTGSQYNLDDNITIGLTNTYFYAGPDGFGHGLPPSDCHLIVAHRNRLFMLNNNYIYWSRSGFPESWKPTEWARRISTFGSDNLTAAFSVYDDLYVCSLRATKRFVYVSDPSAAMIVDIPTNLGAWNQRSIVFAEGRIFGFGPNGVWEIQGIKPNLIGHVLDNQWRPICDFALTQQKTFGFYDQTNRRVVFYYVKQGDTTCKVGIAIDIETGLFSMITTDTYMTAAIQVAYSNRSAVFGTGDTYLFELTSSAQDGSNNISSRILSDWNPLGQNVDRRRVSYFKIESVPITGHSELKVRFYVDGSSTPYDFGQEILNATLPDGITASSTSTEFLVTPKNGIAAVPAPSEWNRYIRYEIESSDGVGDIRISDAYFEPSRARDAGSEA